MANELATIENYLVADDRVKDLQMRMGADTPEKALAYYQNIVAAVRSAEGKMQIALMNCTPESYEEAARKAVSLELMIDGREHGYLIPYGQRVSFQVGWRGYVYRLTRHNPTIDVQIGLVFKGDEFSLESVDGVAKYTHEKKNAFNSDYSQLEGGYCYISYEVGGRQKAIVETMSIKELATVRGAAKQDYVWKKWTKEMLKKVLIKTGSKVLAARAEFSGVLDKLNEEDNKQYDMSRPEVDKSFEIDQTGGLVDVTPEVMETEYEETDQGGDEGVPPAEDGYQEADPQQATEIQGNGGSEDPVGSTPEQGGVPPEGDTPSDEGQPEYEPEGGGTTGEGGGDTFKVEVGGTSKDFDDHFSAFGFLETRLGKLKSQADKDNALKDNLKLVNWLVSNNKTDLVERIYKAAGVENDE